MTRPWRISRRAMLRGALGTGMALPFLEAMRHSSAGAASATPPRRAVFLFIPVGFTDMTRYEPIMQPSPAGLPYTLPTVLAPLEPIQSKLTIIGNLENRICELGNGDGHERGTASLLTCQPAILNGSQFTNGISIDQYLARSISGTAIPSLELGVEQSADSGNSVLSANVSWAEGGRPVAKEVDAGRVWDRLFSELALSADELALRRARRESLLDYTRESATALRTQLGEVDRIKLDQYLSGVADLEARLQQTSQCITPIPVAPAGKYDNSGDPAVVDVNGLTARHDIMLDLMAHALACDITRVGSFMFVNGGFADWRFLGFRDEHHLMSHSANEFAAELDAICTWEIERIAKFCAKLDSIEESDGSTLLDNTLVFVSSDVADGQLHNYDNLPVLLIGGGNSVTKMGQAIRPSNEQPLANLFVSMMRFMGVDGNTFGADGTGPLADVMA
jgi:hypothetical protein